MSINSRGEFRVSSQRPPAPWRFSNGNINLSWHHIIPHSLMRDTWQALAMNRTANKCSVALESYMRLLRVDRPREALKAMMSDQLSPEQQETLDRKLTWASWNIVEGPSFRTDDPEDAFDEFTAGLTESERSRQQRIKSLFLELQIFN